MSVRLSIWSHIAVPMLALAACRRDPVSPLPASLATDARAYVASPAEVVGAAPGYSVRVIARFTNASRLTISRTRCLLFTPYPALPRTQAGGLSAEPWRSAWHCVDGRYPDVAPGESRVDTLLLVLGMHAGTIDAGTIDGQVQLVFELRACRDDSPSCSDPILSTAGSNLFTLRRGN